MHLTIQEDFFLTVFQHERRLANGLTVAFLSKSAAEGSRLILFLVIVRNLRVGFAIKNHLAPTLVLFEHVEHFFVKRVAS